VLATELQKLNSVGGSTYGTELEKMITQRRSKISYRPEEVSSRDDALNTRINSKRQFAGNRIIQPVGR